MTQQTDTQVSLLDPDRWGLPTEAVDELPDRLQRIWHRYRSCFRTCTRDRSEYAYHYLSGLLRMKESRNFVEIGHTTGQAGEIGLWTNAKNPGFYRPAPDLCIV